MAGQWGVVLAAVLIGACGALIYGFWVWHFAIFALGALPTVRMTIYVKRIPTF